MGSHSCGSNRFVSNSYHIPITRDIYSTTNGRLISLDLPDIPDNEIHQLNSLAQDIFQSRYAIHPEETWEQACYRVANAIAAAETGENIPKWKSRFYKELATNRFIPGGRIIRSSGRPLQALLNCFLINPQDFDSREGWGQAVKDFIIISGEGGGVGFNGSEIRPRNTAVRRTGGKATGAVSFFEILNAAAGVIRGGGGRRAAMNLGLNHDHGDISEFMDKKLALGELENANISVNFMNEPIEEFFDKVDNNEDYDLLWQGEKVGEVNAKELWQTLVKNNLANGEPGILNGNLMNHMNNLWYVRDIIGVNPCGELPLSGQGSCCLGSVVLPRFVNRPCTDIRWDLLTTTITASIRFLDNVLDVTHYPIRKIREEAQDTRRIGLGITGLHDILLMLGMQYDSEEGQQFVDKLMKFIRNKAYEASIFLAVEKGQFPLLDREKYIQSGFCKTLKPSTRDKIFEYGIRNSVLLTVPPVGTTSMICGTSSGLEPIFAPAYVRRFREEEELKEETVLHPLFEAFQNEKKDVSHFQGAHDISPRMHLEMQKIVQKYIDSAVSKTINVPKDIDPKELSSLLMEYMPYLKGVTVYPSGSRPDEPLTPISVEEALKMSCPGGACEL